MSGIVSLALLAWAFIFWSSKLERRIKDHAEWAWAAYSGLTSAAKPQTDWHNTVARALRPITGWLYSRIWRGSLVPLLGIVIGVIALVVLSPFWIWRLLRRRPWMA